MTRPRRPRRQNRLVPRGSSESSPLRSCSCAISHRVSRGVPCVSLVYSSSMSQRKASADPRTRHGTRHAQREHAQARQLSEVAELQRQGAELHRRVLRMRSLTKLQELEPSRQELLVQRQLRGIRQGRPAAKLPTHHLLVPGGRGGGFDGDGSYRKRENSILPFKPVWSS